MCYFKRLIYTSCSHSLIVSPEPVRKCYLQLAYDSGQTDIPCGKIWQHSYMSLRVDGSCYKCGRTKDTVNRTKRLLEEMRMRLNVANLDLDRPGGVEDDDEGRKGRGRREVGDGGRDGNEEEEDDGEEFGDETLSPVELSFSSDNSGDGSRQGDGDGSVSSLSLEGVALSAVGCGN